MNLTPWRSARAISCSLPSMPTVADWIQVASLAHRPEQLVGHRRAHRVRVGEHREHRVATPHRLLGALEHLDPVALERRGALAVAVPRGGLDPRRGDVARHRGTHDPRAEHRGRSCLRLAHRRTPSLRCRNVIALSRRDAVGRRGARARRSPLASAHERFGGPRGEGAGRLLQRDRSRARDRAGDRGWRRGSRRRGQAAPGRGACVRSC